MRFTVSYLEHFPLALASHRDELGGRHRARRWRE